MSTELKGVGFLSTDKTGSLVSASITNVSATQVQVTVVTTLFPLGRNSNIISVKHVTSGKMLSAVVQDFKSLGSGQYRWTFANPGNIANLASGQPIVARITVEGEQEWAFYTAQTAGVQAGTSTYMTAAGTDTYTGSLSPALTAYVAGQQLKVKFTNTNTGAATLNVNGLGAKAIVKGASTPLAAGNLVAGKIYPLFYDGTNFQVGTL